MSHSTFSTLTKEAKGKITDDRNAVVKQYDGAAIGWCKAAYQNEDTQPATPRGKHVENTWKPPRGTRGRDVEFRSSMKHFLSWNPRYSTCKTRVINV